MCMVYVVFGLCVCVVYVSGYVHNVCGIRGVFMWECGEMCGVWMCLVYVVFGVCGVCLYAWYVVCGVGV